MLGLFSLTHCSSSTSNQTNNNPEPSASLKVNAPNTGKFKLANLQGSEYIWGKEPCSGVNRSTFRAVMLFLPNKAVRYVYTNVVVSDKGEGKEQQEIWEGSYQQKNNDLTLHFTQITQLQKGFNDDQARQTQQEKIDKTLTFRAVACSQNKVALQNLSELLDPIKGGNWVKK
ncbi:hypothetical protein BKI52_37865 [marine bacterium AO1-C]|nr:hypothetical protein BKI52_37865 [marine bacterium AO1-C]